MHKLNFIVQICHLDNEFYDCIRGKLADAVEVKVSKEERNSGLNSSKLIERWRNIRREAKSKELFCDVTVLQETFERALHRKNRHIELLLQVLNIIN